MYTHRPPVKREVLLGFPSNTLQSRISVCLYINNERVNIVNNEKALLSVLSKEDPVVEIRQPLTCVCVCDFS